MERLPHTIPTFRIYLTQTRRPAQRTGLGRISLGGTSSRESSPLFQLISASRCSFVLLSALIGIVLGMIAGYIGGFVEEVIMRICDLFLAFPVIIMALVVAATLGPSLLNAAISLTFVWWPPYVRLVRGGVLALKSEDYMAASKAMNSSILLHNAEGTASKHYTCSHGLRVAGCRNRTSVRVKSGLSGSWNPTGHARTWINGRFDFKQRLHLPVGGATTSCGGVTHRIGIQLVWRRNQGGK